MTTPNELSLKDLKKDPLEQFLKWFQEAVEAKLIHPDAMTLATASSKGVPTSRIVLYKGTNEKGLRFFTNYRSPKAKDLKVNPRAALLFFWPTLNRQIRVEGKIIELSAQESDEYWRSRPRGSQLASAASQQSAVISGRAVMEKKIKELSQKYEGKEVSRPSHWGGFCLVPQTFEFWIEGESRFHNRFRYTKKRGAWTRVQLSP